jgi:hypothetical protein
MVDATGDGLIGLRDRALVLVGMRGIPPSELVGRRTDDCAFGKDGLTVTLRRSKTDQPGVGRETWHPARIEPRDVPGSEPAIVD